MLAWCAFAGTLTAAKTQTAQKQRALVRRHEQAINTGVGLPKVQDPELKHVRSWSEVDTIAKALDPSVLKQLPLPSPKLIQAVGGGTNIDAHNIGGMSFRYLLALAGLREDSKVLEPGCGFGRNARWLSNFLNANGAYDGFDIVPELIEWGQANITSDKRQNFKFTLAHVQNKFYDDWQKVHYAGNEQPTDAANYRFPIADGEKDIVFNPSVFTHLLRSPLENYVRESFRVLRPGGVALFWMYFLDDLAKDAFSHHSSALNPVLRASYYDDVSWANKVPEAMIAYDVDYFKNLLHSAGFVSVKILFGSWRSTGATTPPAGLPMAPPADWTDAPPDSQDIVFCQRPGQVS